MSFYHPSLGWACSIGVSDTNAARLFYSSSAVFFVAVEALVCSLLFILPLKRFCASGLFVSQPVFTLFVPALAR